MGRNNTLKIERKQKDIELFGLALKITERSAQDVFDVADFASQNVDLRSQFVAMAQGISDALKWNWERLPWWSPKKRKLKKLLDPRNLMLLGQSEIVFLTDAINDLEGSKKKVEKAAENPSDAESPDS